MTYSENITSNSETTLLEKSNSGLTFTDFAVQYSVLDKSVPYILTSPIKGFLNIVVFNDQTSCILPYFLSHNSHIIRTDENAIHAIKPGDKLEWRNINNSMALAIFIDNECLNKLDVAFQKHSEIFKKGLLNKSDNRMLFLCNQILDLNKNSDSIAKLKVLALIIDLISHQIEHIFVGDSTKQQTLHKDHYEKVLLAKKFIEKDLSKNYTIAELSKLVGTNEQYLKKYFKQCVGKTIMQYITDHKMDYAKELIISGDYRISDVAQIIGYKHSTHFTTAFKKHFGFIPNSLRY